MINKDITLEDLGYIKDKEPKVTSIESYTKYYPGGYCRSSSIEFYLNGFSCDTRFVSHALSQAIRNKCKELGIGDFK